MSIILHFIFSFYLYFTKYKEKATLTGGEVFPTKEKALNNVQGF